MLCETVDLDGTLQSARLLIVPRVGRSAVTWSSVPEMIWLSRLDVSMASMTGPRAELTWGSPPWDRVVDGRKTSAWAGADKSFITRVSERS